MEIPAEQLKTLETLGASGDSTAKDMLSNFGAPPVPEKTEEKQESNAQPAIPDKPEGSEGDLKTDDGKNGVDVGRDRSGEDRKPTKIDTIRELRRSRRELQAKLAEQETQNRQFLEKFNALQAKLDSLSPGKTVASEKDNSLEKLLSTPDEFLSEREKRLEQALLQRVEERLKNLPGMMTSILQTRNEKSDAIKILEGIKGFDLDRDEDQVFDIMEEEYGFDEKYVEEMLDRKPTTIANLIKKAWEKRTALPEEKKAEKAAASSSSVSGSATPGSKPTLRELSAMFSAAKGPEEEARILKQIETMSS